ncbi:hypothetical protein TNCV_1803821 [Trichonephila clavipes]|nr:hypothetical protein TNCV_1803821 [Trichonephila clavipes]
MKHFRTKTRSIEWFPGRSGHFQNVVVQENLSTLVGIESATLGLRYGHSTPSYRVDNHGPVFSEQPIFNRFSDHMKHAKFSSDNELLICECE